jgi:hypothetical protein
MWVETTSKNIRNDSMDTIGAHVKKSVLFEQINLNI